MHMIRHDRLEFAFGLGTLYACDAMRGNRRLQIHRSGTSHIVEVHAIGLSENGNPAILAWRAGRRKADGRIQRWSVMELGPDWHYAVLGKPSDAPRHGYNPAATGLSQVFWKVSLRCDATR